MTERAEGPSREPSPVVSAPSLKRLGIVIPVYGHSRFAMEAIVGACQQRTSRSYLVLAVDDGCPNAETQHTLKACRVRFGRQFISVRQRNGGLSAARNLGARTLLDIAPDTDAIFFLDADNRLQPGALDAYAAALESDPSAGWAFPDIAAFGLTSHAEGVDVRETASEDSVLRHLRGNISEAGSLVRTSVFKAGVWFDESMRAGLEDWDFWLTARERGFRGVRVQNANFLYRVRPESMVAQSRRQHDEVISGMRRKHAALFSARAVYRAEHDEAPRFLAVDLDAGTLSLTSDPGAPGQAISLREARDRYRTHLESVYETAFPRFVLIRSGFSSATASRAIRSILFDVLAEPLTRPAVIKVEGSDHASRFFDDIRHARRVSENATGMLAIVPVEELYRLSAENPARPALAMLRDVARLEHWTLPHEFREGDVTRTGRRRLSRLSALLSVFSRTRPRVTLHHANRAYRGPTAQDARKLVVDDICGSGSFIPFPFVAAGRDRCLLSVATRDLDNPQVQAALAAAASALTLAGLRLTLFVEGQTTAALTQQLVDMIGPENLILNTVPGTAPSTFRYHGLDLPVASPEVHHRFIALGKGHDAIVSFGASSILPFLGELKGTSVLTVTAYPNVLIEADARRASAELSAVAAYEHAHHLIAADKNGRMSLAMHGVPASRVVAPDQLAFSIKSRLMRNP